MFHKKVSSPKDKSLPCNMPSLALPLETKMKKVVSQNQTKKNQSECRNDDHSGMIMGAEWKSYTVNSNLDDEIQ